VNQLKAQVCAYRQADVQILGQLGYSLPLLPGGVRQGECPPLP